MPFIDGKHVSLDEWKRRNPPQFSTLNTDGAPPPPEVRASDIAQEFVAPTKSKQSKAVKAAVKAATGVSVDVDLEPTLQFAELDADTEEI